MGCHNVNGMDENRDEEKWKRERERENDIGKRERAIARMRRMRGRWSAVHGRERMKRGVKWVAGEYEKRESIRIADNYIYLTLIIAWFKRKNIPSHWLASFLFQLLYS